MNNEIAKRYDYECIDLLKLIGSIMIFIMHLGVFGSVFGYFSRWAVPFFFMVSSFFFFIKEENNLKKYIKRIGFLYICWFVINLPSIFYNKIYTVGMFRLDTWLQFIKSALLSSTFTGSWYLLGTIVGIVLVCFLRKKVSTRILLLLLFPFQLICICSSLYYGLLPKCIVSIIDFLEFPLNILGGVFYIAIGLRIAETMRRKYEKKQHKINPYVYIVCAVAFLILSILEILIAKSNDWYNISDCSLGIIGTAAFMVLFGLTANIRIKRNRLLRKISTIIFCGQGNIIVGAGFVTHKLLKTNSSVTYLAVAAILMCVLILIVLFIQKKNIFNFSRYLT